MSSAISGSLEQIGAGGMGVVFRARDEHLDRDMALKVLPSGALGDPDARRRFRNEALALSRINHPHIATIFDFATEGNLDFLAMELVPALPWTANSKADRFGNRRLSLLGRRSPLRSKAHTSTASSTGI